MTKSRFFKTIVFLILLNLVILVSWLIVLFLMQKDRLILQGSKLVVSAPVSLAKTTALKQDQITRLDNYFLTSSSTLKFLEQLESVGQKTGVKLQIGQATEGKDQLQLQLSAIGSYAQVTRLMRSLENLPYAVRLSRFDLGTDGKVWTGNFTLIILSTKDI